MACSPTCLRSIPIFRMERAMSKQCAACGRIFRPCPQVPNQSYCSAPECQHERRRRWQRKKLRTDPDYRDNQSRSNKDWVTENPDYWRKYRDKNPDYVDSNRKKQQARNKKRQKTSIAKMDALAPTSVLPSGRYRLTPVPDDRIAKMDAWIVEINVLSSIGEDFPGDCKDRT